MKTMGIHYHLHVMGQDNKKEDIGGYAKGDTKPHWIFAFAEEDYKNNLKSIKERNDLVYANIHYTTTVEKALQRLKETDERLHAMRGKRFSFSMARKYITLCNGIFELRHALHSYSPNDTVQLDERESSPYRLKWEEDKVIGLEDSWYQNEALTNEEKIATFENFEMTLEDVITSYAKELPNETIHEFCGEFYDVMNHNDRGYGPSEISRLLFEEEEKESTRFDIDNPRVFFKTVMDEMITRLTEEREVTETLKILYYNIEETLEYKGITI